MPTGDDRDARRLCRALQAFVGIPVTSGNRLRVLHDGAEIFPAMLDAIGAAEHTIDLLTYVWWAGEPSQRFTEALSERARAGVRVRVLVDDIGARLMPEEHADGLREAGVDLHRFRPVDDLSMWRNTHRTHRRVLVVDDRLGFTGGVGIADEWDGGGQQPHGWRETHLQIEGPAVNGLRAAFLENWAETPSRLFESGRERFPTLDQPGDTTAMVVASSAGHGVSRMSILKRVLIDVAEHRVRITSAYLAAEDGALTALAAACERGVEVELLVPGQHVDKRVAGLAAQQQFSALMDMGVKIHLYQRTMLHAKVITVDGLVADVGSANFNARSFSQDEELDVVAFDPEIVQALDAHFDEDLEHSEPVTRERWEQRGALQRAAENAVGLLGDVM